MYQLKYDDDFTCIIKDVPYFKNVSDIPKNILDKFIEYIESIGIILNNNTKKFNCIKCGCELDKDFYCKTCNTNYEKIYEENLDEWLTSSSYCHYSYYVFDIIDTNVILYLIDASVDFWCCKTYTSHIYKTINFEISNAFFIENNGFRDLTNSLFYSFDEYYNMYCRKQSDDIDDELLQKYEILEETLPNSYLYKENLDELKNTIYKYSFIWNAKEFLNGENLSIKNLIFLPIYFKEFEYLMKAKLFNLAFNSPNIFEKDKTFNEIFQIDKKHIPFMIENNITWDELRILRVCTTSDMELIRFFTNYSFNIDSIVYIADNLKINLQLLRDYFIRNKLSNEYINEYLDYIFLAEVLGMDLKDKNVVYPKNLLSEHDKLFVQMEVTRDPTIDTKIRSLAEIISINKYEDEKYIIYPAGSINELVEESTEQHNCVRTYCDMIANNECQIYFMRKKEDVNKSFVTIEVRNITIVQARMKYNELPDKEINIILNKWEKGLIPVLNEG